MYNNHFYLLIGTNINFKIASSYFIISNLVLIKLTSFVRVEQEQSTHIQKQKLPTLFCAEFKSKLVLFLEST